MGAGLLLLGLLWLVLCDSDDLVQGNGVSDDAEEESEETASRDYIVLHEVFGGNRVRVVTYI